MMFFIKNPLPSLSVHRISIDRLYNGTRIRLLSRIYPEGTLSQYTIIQLKTFSIQYITRKATLQLKS